MGERKVYFTDGSPEEWPYLVEAGTNAAMRCWRSMGQGTARNDHYCHVGCVAFFVREKRVGCLALPPDNYTFAALVDNPATTSKLPDEPAQRASQGREKENA